jgi:hypothetical protein
VDACGGQLARTVHAQGGRDASFYLPAFLNYFAHGFPARTLVTHVHMQALPANVALIEALDLRPVIMLRAIPDMLASYWDMLEGDNHLSPNNWINLQVPPQFAAMREGEKADFLVQMVAPWYASYFATWLDYARAAPSRVLMLDYDAFRADPAATLQALLTHSRITRELKDCRAALDALWQDRTQFRFNKGVTGRGAARFGAIRTARLQRQLAFYPGLADFADRLIPPL